ncbi:methionine aminotransferase [Lentimicrobium sp. L6]|uniref:methionine aminotransferase n=1 Tax=Lentimicrobium sp. L6 TaxID=2735916 RepID=UPI001557D03D|nr:methionine aminotransferase [Lentimicrobium sp. L6]NPD83357.1 methionine aminotransferase [Lentimicrobium sp. L6]
MEAFKGSIISKSPGVKTSIFAVMSQMANEHNAINLAQGFPDFDVDAELINLIAKNMRKGHNQYAPMPGLPELRQQIVAKIKNTFGAEYNADTEVTVTSGATQALFTAISAFVRDEDEVIVFEPAYDSYSPTIKLNRGIVKYAKLRLPDYHIDWTEVSRMISHRTRMIILNTPHNPTGAVLSKKDLDALHKLTKNTDIIILSDEVYEHIIFDKKKHHSLSAYPGLAERSIVVASFGKTFHATGWKMGYAVAPENLMNEFRKTHQFIVFTVNTPIQHAIAEHLKDEGNYLGLGSFYQKKRDYFLKLIKNSRFKPVPSFGTYFQVLDYSEISDLPEMEFAEWLIKEHGVASVPVSAFYHKNDDHKMLRFCFAKKEETLEKAAEILCKI